MAPPGGTEGSQATLSAIYNAPTASRNLSLPISTPLPSIDSTSVKAKTAYLAELRSKTKELQENINVFLTQKMEEDKSSAKAESGQGNLAGKTTDEVEEDHYGEEDAEDDGS